MARQTDYALYHCGDWKDGQPPVIKTKIIVVSYDTRNRAYAIDTTDLENGSFVEWVAANWETDNSPRGFWNEETEEMDDEEAQPYLDRIGVRVWEA